METGDRCFEEEIDIMESKRPIMWGTCNARCVDILILNFICIFKLLIVHIVIFVLFALLKYMHFISRFVRY